MEAARWLVAPQSAMSAVLAPSVPRANFRMKAMQLQTCVNPGKLFKICENIVRFCAVLLMHPLPFFSYSLSSGTGQIASSDGSFECTSW